MVGLIADDYLVSGVFRPTTPPEGRLPQLPTVAFTPPCFNYEKDCNDFKCCRPCRRDLSPACRCRRCFEHGQRPDRSLQPLFRQARLQSLRRKARLQSLRRQARL